MGQAHVLKRSEPLLLVGAGGFAGAILRHAVSLSLPTPVVGTLAVNVLGSFALGVIVALPADDSVALALSTGFCGAFTTFSSFAFESVRLVETGRTRRAVGVALGTLVAALLAVGLGVAFVSVLA